MHLVAFREQDVPHVATRFKNGSPTTVRVGLEDSLWDGPGTLAATNAAQVKRIRSIIEALSLEVATPDEARDILKLKGKNSVGF